ncbi:APC family permease [Thermohalobacter berrensis]|uniref:Amino acid permease n=1 Tax=Thermohalobacter berrensis TaxID=99594 RepID=A0A419TB41_9FIRM|nr:amino acid permease [Thermohalobacter berrensis]RKD34696.1 amino acid permease [Thermohalobacter berrensis]
MEAKSQVLNSSIKTNNSDNLKKEIGLIDAISVVIGIVIGSGIFFKASMVFKSAGTPMLGLLAWVIGGLITMASALTIAEIATAIPKTGGVFAYLKELYGEKWAFLFGWVQTFIYIPGAGAALAIILATQATYFIPMTEIQQKLLAITVLLTIIVGNILSTKLGSRIQFISTIGKLVPIFIIIIFGILNGTNNNLLTSSTGTVTVTGFGTAILGTLWAYDGWISVGNIAGELKNPKKDIPKAIIFGILTIIIVYVLINLAIIKVIPVENVVKSVAPASDAANKIFGSAGGNLISAGILISIFGALNGYLLTGVRIPFAMAKNGLLPFSKHIGKIDERFNTPLNSFVFEGILICIYIFTGSFEALTNLVIFVLWIFFTMTVAGIFILRKKYDESKRPYKVPLYPIIPLIGICGGLYIIFSTLITSTGNALIGLALTFAGLPFYNYIKKKRKVL